MKPIPKEICQKVNQLAHDLAMKFEYETRSSLMLLFRDDADSGATLKELSQTLNRFEAQGRRTGRAAGFFERRTSVMTRAHESPKTPRTNSSGRKPRNRYPRPTSWLATTN